MNTHNKKNLEAQETWKWNKEHMGGLYCIKAMQPERDCKVVAGETCDKEKGQKRLCGDWKVCETELGSPM